MTSDLAWAARQPAWIEISAGAWLEARPSAGERLRRALPNLPPLTRAHVLLALARSGATDLLPDLRSLLLDPKVPIEARLHAMRALVVSAARTGDPRAVELLLGVADRGLREALASPSEYAQKGLWTVALQGFVENAWCPARAEALLYRWWIAIPRAQWAERGEIAWTLGHVGGRRAREFLSGYCAYAPAAKDPYASHEVREVARAAVGMIESRLESRAEPR